MVQNASSAAVLTACAESWRRIRDGLVVARSGVRERPESGHHVCGGEGVGHGVGVVRVRQAGITLLSVLRPKVYLRGVGARREEVMEPEHVGCVQVHGALALHERRDAQGQDVQLFQLDTARCSPVWGVEVGIGVDGKFRELHELGDTQSQPTDIVVPTELGERAGSVGAVFEVDDGLTVVDTITNQWGPQVFRKNGGELVLADGCTSCPLT